MFIDSSYVYFFVFGGIFVALVLTAFIIQSIEDSKKSKKQSVDQAKKIDSLSKASSEVDNLSRQIDAVKGTENIHGIKIEQMSSKVDIVIDSINRSVNEFDNTARNIREQLGFLKSEFSEYAKKNSAKFTDIYQRLNVCDKNIQDIRIEVQRIIEGRYGSKK